MENKSCWRYKMVVSFLDEEESKEIHSIYDKCITFTKGSRVRNKASLNDIFKPVGEACEEMIGFKNMHHNTIMHHGLSLLGPACPNCGKPLRTPEAKLCPECGWKKIRKMLSKISRFGDQCIGTWIIFWSYSKKHERFS